ncbi:SAM pointed domain-containing Ets transcription factor [Galendromus occidentalis]|uniref:SAM pointed domain-containing Ets transcription factor n=1 Tax=Galendromus occidentalis TaxID=34638 RepID=A0AAJ7WJ21_9ACAR|nr:SAM pointed domain-containing Ets transcription factor [Galendromus occidentalis]
MTKVGFLCSHRCSSSAKTPAIEMKQNLAPPDSFMRSEPQKSAGSNSLGTEQDFPWRIPDTAGPINSLELPSMNDTLEHLRALCLQQAASDVQRACRQLCISSNPHDWNTIDVQNWLQWLSNERKIDKCWKTLDFLMKCTGSQLIGFCEDPRRWIDLMDLQSVHLLVMDKIAANLDIWRSGTQCAHFHVTGNPDPKLWDTMIPTHHDLTISPEVVYYNNRRPSSSACSEESDEDSSKPMPGSSGHQIHLWQFLRQLLSSPQHQDCIRWIDKAKNIFKIENSVRVAKLWGQRKNRPAMNYDKLSRSIRQYYRKGIIRKTEQAQRLVYQFCGPLDIEKAQDFYST